jgi:cytochrome c553
MRRASEMKMTDTGFQESSFCLQVLNRHRLFVVAVILGLVLSPRVEAAPSSYVAWTTETVALIRNADAERGRQLAFGCDACHGTAGLGESPAYPHIAGQDARYLYKQLHDYKDKTRKNPQMNGIAASLSEQEMADIATYFAALSAPLPDKGGGNPVAENLARRGHGSRMVPACMGCHGSRGKGNAGYYGMPVLAGQKAVYLSIALRQYKANDRANDVYSVMRAIAGNLTDDEITALGKYYASQDPR